MTNKVIVRAGGVFALALLGVSGATLAGDSQGRVVYQGDHSAKAVCMSIVYDDVDELMDAFRHGRSHPLERSYLAYECNSLSLDEFAFTMNAEEVSDYLAPKFGRKGTVTIEQVGSINN